VVILYGRVPSFYLKQMAQELAGGLPGVERLANRIEVDPTVGGAIPGQW
jgi:hypothetical protein